MTFTMSKPKTKKPDPPEPTLEEQQQQRLAALQQIVDEQKRKQAAYEEKKRLEREAEEAERKAECASGEISDTRPCEGCQQPFESKALTIGGKEICRIRYCATCAELRQAEADEEQARKVVEAKEAAFQARWESLCPPRYAEPFDIDKLIASIRESEKGNWKPEMEATIRAGAQKVEEWPYSDRGIGLIGVSGHGKTRIMFRLLHRYLREGRKCAYINLAVFGREIGARFSKGAQEANDWVNKLCKVPVLFFDDVGKEKMTERVETELYGIVEIRSANLLPIYFTANSKGHKLMEKMKDDDGEISDRALPIVRRLREFCEGVTI